MTTYDRRAWWVKNIYIKMGRNEFKRALDNIFESECGKERPLHRVILIIMILTYHIYEKSEL